VARLTGGVASLLRKHGVTVVNGRARIIDGKTVAVAVRPDSHPDSGDMRIRCEQLLLATGSVAAALPGLPFGGPVISATEALSPESLPRRLVVVGAGYIGLELGMAYRKLGAEVTVVEATDRILPAYDADLAKPVAASLRGLGIDLRLGTRVRAEKGPADGDGAATGTGVRLALEGPAGAD